MDLLTTKKMTKLPSQLDQLLENYHQLLETLDNMNFLLMLLNYQEFRNHYPGESEENIRAWYSEFVDEYTEWTDS